MASDDSESCGISDALRLDLPSRSTDELRATAAFEFAVTGDSSRFEIVLDGRRPKFWIEFRRCGQKLSPAMSPMRFTLQPFNDSARG